MAENDFVNDMADDADRELEASTPQYNNGNKANNRAGLEDILVRQNTGGGFNPVKEAVTGSENPAEYWVRTSLTADEIQDDVLIYGELQWGLDGYEDVPWMMYAEYHLRRSENGNALRMMEAMHVGQMSYKRDMFTGAVKGGILRRANTINNEQIEPSS
jgi:hypothetical protein